MKQFGNQKNVSRPSSKARRSTWLNLPLPPAILLGGADGWPQWLDPVSSERWRHILDEHGPDAKGTKPRFNPDTDIANAIYDTVTKGKSDYDQADGKVRSLVVNNQLIVAFIRPNNKGDGFFIVTVCPAE